MEGSWCILTLNLLLDALMDIPHTVGRDTFQIFMAFFHTELTWVLMSIYVSQYKKAYEKSENLKFAYYMPGIVGVFFTIIRCIFSTSMENCCDEKDCFVTERSIMCLDFRSVLHSVSKWLHLYITQNDDLLLSKYGALLLFSRVFKQIFVILVIQICLFIWSCLGHPVFIFENWVFARKRRYFSDKYSSFQHISHNNHCYLGCLTVFSPHLR